MGMKSKPLICFLWLSMFACQLFSQRTVVENNKSSQLNSEFYNSASSWYRRGLGYFSNPDENLFDLYHYNQFPDSIYGYNYGNNQEVKSLNERLYFTMTDNTLQARNYSEIFYTAGDIFFYNKAGLLDSAILESEADQEYDDYAIKHVFTYTDDLMVTEKVFTDRVNDSLSDDWMFVQETFFSYDSQKRMKDKVINHLNLKTKNKYYYNTTNEGFTQVDSSFIAESGSDWVVSGISYRDYNSNNKCIRIKNLLYNLMYSSAYYSDPDRLGMLDSVNKIRMDYDNNGNLISVLEDSYNIYTNRWQLYDKCVFEYNQGGTRKSKTNYDFSMGYWIKIYSFNYFYNQAVKKITEVQNIQFKLFPNPVNDFLNIEGIKNGYDLIISSFDGKIVRKQKCGNTSISVSDLPNGVYILNIFDNKSLISKQQFVKK
jgi:hypothetical protein